MSSQWIPQIIDATTMNHGEDLNSPSSSNSTLPSASPILTYHRSHISQHLQSLHDDNAVSTPITHGGYAYARSNDPANMMYAPQVTSAPSVDAMSLKRDREKEGRCADCGIQTHKIVFLEAESSSMARSTKEPLTIENEVHRGRCLFCRPLPNMMAHSGDSQQQQQCAASPQGSTRSLIRALPNNGSSRVQSETTSKTILPDNVHSALIGTDSTAPSCCHDKGDMIDNTCEAPHEIPNTSSDPMPIIQQLSPANHVSDSTPTATRTNIYSTAEEALTMAIDFGTTDLCDILSIMRRFPSNSTIQERGCKQIWIQSWDDETACAIGRVGGISTVVDAMRYHQQNAQLQQSACEALQNLAASNDYNRDVIADQGGIAAITDAMRVHQFVMGVQTRGCAALANIAVGSLENKINVVECGGVHATVRAVESFPGEEKVVLAAYQVLRVIGYAPRFQQDQAVNDEIEGDIEMES